MQYFLIITAALVCAALRMYFKKFLERRNFMAHMSHPGQKIRYIQ